MRKFLTFVLAPLLLLTGCELATTLPELMPTVQLLTPAPRANAVLGAFESAEVTGVVDGDTIKVRRAGQTIIETIRYIGMDTPETVHPTRGVQPFGKEASDFNKTLVIGKQVRLEKDVSETDRFGRLLRYVWVTDAQGVDMMVNAELVRQGLAKVSTYPPDVKHTELFRALEREARAAGRGLWSTQ